MAMLVNQMVEYVHHCYSLFIPPKERRWPIHWLRTWHRSFSRVLWRELSQVSKWDLWEDAAKPWDFRATFESRRASLSAGPKVWQGDGWHCQSLGLTMNIGGNRKTKVWIQPSKQTNRWHYHWFMGCFVDGFYNLVFVWLTPPRFRPISKVRTPFHPLVWNIISSFVAIEWIRVGWS